MFSSDCDIFDQDTLPEESLAEPIFLGTGELFSGSFIDPAEESQAAAGEVPREDCSVDSAWGLYVGTPCCGDVFCLGAPDCLSYVPQMRDEAQPKDVCPRDFLERLQKGTEFSLSVAPRHESKVLEDVNHKECVRYIAFNDDTRKRESKPVQLTFEDPVEGVVHCQGYLHLKECDCSTSLIARVKIWKLSAGQFKCKFERRGEKRDNSHLKTVKPANDLYKKTHNSNEKDVAICLRKLRLCDHFEPGTLVFVVVSLENDQEVFIAHTFDATTHKRIGRTIVANAEGQFGYPKPLFSFYPEGNLTFSGEGVLVVLWGTVMFRMEFEFVVDTKTVPSVFKDGWRIGDLLQAPDERRCALVRTRMLLDTVLEGSFPHSMIERTFNDPEMVKDLAYMALESGLDDECFALTFTYNDLVMHYHESSVMNTEIALHALCLGQYALAERLSDELMVDWDLLDDEELAILRDDEKSYDLLDTWGCDRIETVHQFAVCCSHLQFVAVCCSYSAKNRSRFFMKLLHVLVTWRTWSTLKRNLLTAQPT